jgi:hypothetical protein
MLRNRILFVLGVSFLAASAAWADDVGYVDCSNHSEDTQVFAKPRKTPDVIEAIPCGQRFTIVTYGFFFSRIQTGDGKVGYIYSSLIAVDRAATSAQKTGSVQMAAEKQKLPSTAASSAPAAPAPSVQPQSQPAPAQASTRTTAVRESAVAAQPNPATIASTQPDVAQPVVTPAPAPVSKAPEAVASVTPAAPAQPQSAAQPAVPEASPSISSVPEKAAATLPTPPASAQPEPEPAPAQPAAAPIRPAVDSTRWEKPNPTVRTAPLIELYGGYSFARLVSGGSGSNLNGALGSFGWSIKPWLQIVADTSYNVVTTNGTKNVLYGNHYGPRYFHRSRNRWGITPFAEALFGGSRADTTITGTGGYTTSDNCFSIKVGGGLDMHPSRRWDIRLFDADYYRTSFGTNVHQNNYWISTGVVLRLMGGSE